VTLSNINWVCNSIVFDCGRPWVCACDGMFLAVAGHTKKERNRKPENPANQNLIIATPTYRLQKVRGPTSRGIIGNLFRFLENESCDTFSDKPIGDWPLGIFWGGCGSGIKGRFWKPCM